MNRLRKETIIPKTVKTAVMFSWIVTTIILLIAVVYYITAQPELPIFYSLARKSDQLARKEFLFIFPSLSLILNTLNLTILKTLRDQATLMIKLFANTTMVLQFLLLIALVRIVLITI